MKKKIFSFLTLNSEVKFIGLIAMTIYHTYTTAAIFVFILGLIITDIFIFIASAIIYIAGLIYAITTYRINIKKIDIPNKLHPLEDLPPPPKSTEPNQYVEAPTPPPSFPMEKEITMNQVALEKKVFKKTEPEPEEKPQERVKPSLLG